MPKAVIDYSNTIIYKITCKDVNINDIYVGHTTNFVQRKYSHKQSCVNIKCDNYNSKVYKIIRENGGWDNWNMTIIDFVHCNTGYEARLKEQEYYKSLNATLNSVEPLSGAKNIICPIVEKKTYYCETCNIYTLTLKQLNAHYITSKHEKKLNEKISDTVINKCFTCDSCSFATSNKKDYNKHILTPKHIKNTENISKYGCSKCDYNTSNKSDFKKHILTPKHIKNTEKILIEKKTYSCICGQEYKHRQSLYNHKKKCNYTENNNKLLESDGEKIDYKELLFNSIKQTTELQHTLNQIIPKIGWCVDAQTIQSSVVGDTHGAI